MPTIKINKSRDYQFGGSVAYGNLTTLRFALATTAAGAVVNSDSATPVAVGDKIVLGTLPEGMVLEDAQVIVQTGMTATVTGSLGFEYEDGTDDPSAPQDAAYFGTGLNLAAAARLRAATPKLLTLGKDARLILTIAGAANAKASALTVIVTGERMGAK